jgi:hypothetical protein
MLFYILLIIIILLFIKIIISQQSLCNDIIYNYKLKDKVPVIISLTTSPKRINNLKYIINNIFSQTIQPDYIYLNLPKIFKRTNEIFSNIPIYLNHPKISINYVNDIGPITKILPTLKNNFPLNSLIISVDDDTIFDKYMIEIMLKYNQAFPNSVLTGVGHINMGRLILEPIPHRVGNMIEGFSAVAYPYKLFKNINIDLNLPKECYFSDDFILSNYINNNNIPIIIVYCFETIYNIKQLEYGFDKDALHKRINNTDDNTNDVHTLNYAKCAKYYKSKNQLSNKLEYWL